MIADQAVIVRVNQGVSNMYHVVACAELITRDAADVNLDARRGDQVIAACLE